ncbi:MAG TPA: PP2C family protein-serine/threonine phosphatase [Candidatus Polarisedimenticolaceae bacterium]|nr:PP2C family protein-serine/threonine phosphatase [Candidatus Polarisedimenticolaceae bacterium]
MSESLTVADRTASGASPAGWPSASGHAPKPAVAWGFTLGWALGWALVGTAVAAGILFSRGSSDFRPLWISSVLFAEVVGFTSLVSARLIFPLYRRLPFALRIVVQVATLVVGTVAGSAAVFAIQPLYFLAYPRLLAVIMLINAVLAVFVGIAVHTYDAMRRELEANFRALRAKEALEREVAIAREVQRELLPRAIPEVRGLELAGVCLPAIGVGGDYYDFLPLPDERVGIVIADVSGKGIPAALLMAGLQASVRSLALPGISPCEINRRLNDMLHQSTSASRYATLFFAIYDPVDRSLLYSNAGHFPPLHCGPREAARLSQGGLPIGLMPGSLYGEGRRELGVGDLLALFTDGVVETPSPAGEEFGTARLVEVLSRHRDQPLDAVVSEVVDAVARWSGGGAPHDDLTLVLARAR